MIAFVPILGDPLVDGNTPFASSSFGITKAVARTGSSQTAAFLSPRMLDLACRLHPSIPWIDEDTKKLLPGPKPDVSAAAQQKDPVKV